jgi:hypothetical protein
MLKEAHPNKKSGRVVDVRILSLRGMKVLVWED